MIAFLHTLEANVEKFKRLIEKHAPQLEAMHFVNNLILENALNSGTVDTEGFDAEVEKIKALKPERIICTCSTYGEAADRRGDVERIDRPIANYIVKKYSRIGLAYTAHSTLSTSARLLESEAHLENKKIDIITIPCTEAWPYYTTGDHTSYVRMIAKTIAKRSPEVDLIFLAQASMEQSKDFLHESTVEILASPEFGIKHYAGLV